MRHAWSASPSRAGLGLLAAVGLTETVQATTEATTTETAEAATTEAAPTETGEAVAAAGTPDDSDPEWGWIAFGILAAAVAVGGIVWLVRRRTSGPGAGDATPSA